MTHSTTRNKLTENPKNKALKSLGGQTDSIDDPLLDVENESMILLCSDPPWMAANIQHINKQD